MSPGLQRHARALGIAALLLVLPVASTAQSPCTPTRPDALGPFYTPDAPERPATGRGFAVSGTVRSRSGCTPISGARLEWWSANGKGDYDDEHRATQITSSDGRFRYETDFPGRYPGRPPHVHVRVSAPGHRVLVTQLYPRPGQTTTDVDFVLTRE